MTLFTQVTSSLYCHHHGTYIIIQLPCQNGILYLKKMLFSVKELKNAVKEKTPHKREVFF